MRAATHRLRLALSLALAAALAGCVVDVEGAACPTPGATTGCPAGQSCGTGGTCSRAAAGCSPCTPGELACRDGDVRRCTAEGDPACGAWAVEAACAAGTTTCDVPAGGAPECRCEAFVADPAGAAASTACRFASAEAAIAEAVRFGVTEVRLGGPAGQDYGGPGPLTIPAGMAVVGDDVPLAPAGRILTLDAAGAAVVLGDGASLVGVTVRAGGVPGAGVAIAAASPGGRSSLTSVVIDDQGPGGAFTIGVSVTGAGAVSLVDVAVRGASVAGLEVARAAAGEVVTASDLLVDGGAATPAAPGDGYGVLLTTGDLTLRRPVVKRCGGAGVSAAGSLASARLSLEGGTLHANFGLGLAAQGLGRLSLAGTRICKNRGADLNLNGTTRHVGGVFLGGTAPGEQAVSGLRVHENDGDQLAVGPGPGTWALAGPSADGARCGAGVNAFSGYSAGPPATFAVVVAGHADVSWNAWPNSVPELGADVLRIGTATATLGTEGNGTAYCSLPSDLTCPDP